MRIPLSWLAEYICLTQHPSEIARLLTMIGLEVDSYEVLGEALQDIVVGHVLEVAKHPNADKLCVAQVSDGRETYQVVCGASNCRPGLKTALARIGATLKDAEGSFKIKKGKLRGIESFGMLCSAAELHLSGDEDGIIELPEDAVAGTSLADLYGDVVFEISLTPNLSHCTSVRGVARELSAATGLALKTPNIQIEENGPSIEESLQVSIVDTEACPRYAVRLIKNVKVAASPTWLKERLEKAGLRSVNNIVDVTNYVLLELGHPLHAFDYDKLNGHSIVVRKAKEGELLQTLDGKQRILKESMLVIADAKLPVAVAGVMGGAESEVDETTRHIVLESAYFHPVSIRKTSKQLGLQTDASKRFERGTDPNQLLEALNRATLLIQQVAGGEIQTSIIDKQAKTFGELAIKCRLSRTNQLLGTHLSRGEVETIFAHLQFNYRFDGQDSFKVKVPTYRVDIKEEIDLIEEIARFYGYDNIPRQIAKFQASNLAPAPIYLFEKEVRTRLIAEGMQELLTCDLIGPALLNVVQDHSMPDEARILVLNPTSIEQSVLRTSLLPGLLQVVKYNLDHQNHSLAGFEIGRIHFKDREQFKEQPVVGIILTGKLAPAHWSDKSCDCDFYDLKGIIENLLAELGIDSVEYRNLDLKTFHTGRQASIFAGDLEVGSFGEIHPSIQRRLDVSQRILFAELDLHDLMHVKKRLERVKPLAIYPGSERDWTLTIREDFPYANLLDIVYGQHSSLLESVTVKDIYRSEKLSPGYQNITLRFSYRDLTKTIAQEVVDTEHMRLTTLTLQELGDAVKV